MKWASQQIVLFIQAELYLFFNTKILWYETHMPKVKAIQK